MDYHGAYDHCELGQSLHEMDGGQDLATGRCCYDSGNGSGDTSMLL